MRYWTACSGVLFSMFGFVFLPFVDSLFVRACSFSFFLFHAPTQKERKRTKRKKNAALGFCIFCVHGALGLRFSCTAEAFESYV